MKKPRPRKRNGRMQSIGKIATRVIKRLEKKAGRK